MVLSTRPSQHALPFAALLVALAGCGGGGGSGDSGSSLPPGTSVENPSTGLFVVIEKNNAGDGTTLNFRDDPVWGRLVDIVAIDPATSGPRTYYRDYLIGEDITSGPDYSLARNPATGREVLTVLHVFGTPAYQTAFARLEDGLQRFLDKGLGANVLPPFTAMPRNAALALRFDDLLEATSVSSATVLVETGYPPSTPLQARIFPDPNHGDFVNGTFHSTRVIIDMSVSQAEAQAAGISPNPIGLPEAIEVNQPNVVVRIPTILSAAATQFELLTNLSSHSMPFGGNGSTLSTSPTLDVIRAFRSGGRQVNTGDDYNGFLRDDEAPRVLGSLGVTVTLVSPVGNQYDVDLIFAAPACALAPRVGDLIVLSGGVTAQVILPGNPPGGFGSVSNVRCTLIAGNPAAFLPGSGQYRTPWDTSVPVAPECFVRFSPGPLTAPASGVSSDASIQVGFTEPMLPDSLNSFDGFVIQQGAGGAPPFDRNVVAVVTSGLDLQDFSFDPLVELHHVAPAQETYSVELTGVVTDLAGNPLANLLPVTQFTLNGAAPTKRSGNISFTFSDGVSGFPSANVDDNGDGKPDFRGQYIFDAFRGEIRPRSVDRFSGVVDTDRCSVSAMSVPGIITITSAGGVIITPVGALEPLSPHGSRTMTTWRYFDLGLSLLDESTYNIDVEGLAWAPFSQGLALDFFSQFQIALAHSLFLPDETISTMSFSPQAPSSGLLNVFAANLLDPANDPLTVVHHRTEGYLVQPLDQFSAPSGTLLAPWPLNHRKAPEDFNYYTYRDTALTAVGGFNSTGADPLHIGAGGAQLLLCPESTPGLFGTPPSGLPDWIDATGAYAGGTMPEIPSIGLPLLMDFRTYPNSNAQGLNLLTWRLATGFTGFAPVPTFRIHSTGAQMPNGTIVQVNPDQQISASGGFDVFGQPTPGFDEGFYLGQADFVVRVSRVHSIWLDAGNPSSWKPALLLPNLLTQPSGTSVSVAFRGAVQLTASAPGDPDSANFYDPYGNMPSTAGGGSLAVQFLNSDSDWKDDITELDGARYVQARITMVSNVVSGVSPTLTALGLSFSN